MIRKLCAEFKKTASDKRYAHLFDTLLFIIITLAIHYLYRFWMLSYDFRIFGFQVITPGLEIWFAHSIFITSSWIVDTFIPVKLLNNTFYFFNQCSITINTSCSGVKQILQFAVLMLLFPGPWKHKSWYIPLGILAVYITNVMRIVGLCIVMDNWPSQWHFAHNYPFRVIFYVVIFILWAIWNDHFNHPRLKAKVKSNG